MPPRPREPAPTPGLLASAFSFVTREIESFVTAATGGDVEKLERERTQPEASSSRVTLDGKRRERGDGREKERERERRGKRVRKRSEVEDRARAKRRLREEVEGERSVRPVKKKASVQREERERSSEREAADDEDDEPPELPVKPLPKSMRKKHVLQPRTEEEVPQPPSREKSSSKDAAEDASKLMPPPPNPMPPPPTPLTTKRVPFPTMPGSLFPRSASMMPDTPAVASRRAVPQPRTPSPPPTATTDLEAVPEELGEPEEANSGSPERSRRGRSRDRDRRRSEGPEQDRLDSSSVRESSRHSDASIPVASSSRRAAEEHAEPEIRPRSAKGKERACDTSGEIRVRGMEKELREAREDHERNAHGRDDGERERDKHRIRMLEEEVARLRAELAIRSASGAGAMPPPPPPPPPPQMRIQVPTATALNAPNLFANARASLKHTAPPVEAPINGGMRTRKAGQPTVNVPSDKMAAFLREMKSVRLRKVGEPAGVMGPPPVPASAAGDIAGERTRNGGGMSDARRAAILGDASFDAGVAARIFIREKRKRDLMEEPVAGPSKRRETTFVRTEDAQGSSSASSSQSSAPSSVSQASESTASGSQSSQTSTSSASTSLFEVPSQPRPRRARADPPLRIWRSTETDITTPSLCSDNENEHSEDRPPDTPSDGGRHSGIALPSIGRQPPTGVEIIDVDALDIETPLKRERSEPVEDERPRSKSMDAFASRVPASPMPLTTPTKPKPPARTAKMKTPMPSKLLLPRRVPRYPAPGSDAGSDSDDPLLMARERPVAAAPRRSGEDRDGAGPSRLPRQKSTSNLACSRSQSQSQSQSQSRSESQSRAPLEMQTEDSSAPRPDSRLSNYAKRRLTLDEELRRAGDSLWQDEDEEDARAPPSEPEEDVDSGQLVATGMKSSRHGFLARGGGAGPPVFMGEGYVQGAVPQGRDEEDVFVGRAPARSGSGSSKGARRR